MDGSRRTAKRASAGSAPSGTNENDKRPSKRRCERVPRAIDGHGQVESVPSGTAAAVLLASVQLDEEKCSRPEGNGYGAPAVDEATREAILRLATFRLVASRRREMEELQSKLKDVRQALLVVDSLHKQLQDRVDRDLTLAAELSASCGASERERSIGSFSQYFRLLIRSLWPPSASAPAPAAHVHESN